MKTYNHPNNPAKADTNTELVRPQQMTTANVEPIDTGTITTACVL
ncbi:hypothetical protein [Nubsella zeaxanthinifaciens]|nr:hypothetical protein [Nubsella zeaxanthinifaciens]